MSRIKDTVKEMKKEKEWIEAEEFWESKKTPVTFRLEADDLWRMDYLVEHLDRSRSFLAGIFVQEALVEAMEEMGFDLEKQKEMIFNDMKAKHEAKKTEEGK